MTRTLLILPILALAGCAGPAKGQESLEADRLGRIETGLSDHGDRITALGDRITDDRFDAVTAQLVTMETKHEKGLEDVRDSFAGSLDALNETLGTLSEQLQLLTIIISTVAGGGVLGGGAVYKLTQPKKASNGSEA